MNSEKSVILLVDDYPKNLEVLYEVLNEKNYDVRIAKNGSIALEIVESTSPDLIFLDVMMPEMNGFEICCRLKNNKRTRDIPVIFMTVLSETINKIRGFELGAVDYITKPIQIQEVLTKINTHLTLRNLLEREKEIARLKSHFISMSFHDLRIPLNIILSANAFIKDHLSRLSDYEKIRRIDMIEDAGKKMVNILDNILIYSRSESWNIPFYPEYVNMFNFCKNIADEFNQLTGYSHNIQFSCPDELQAKLDPNLMRHVISNILSNSIKYSPPGSRIDFNVFKDADEICIRITDEGIGIPETNQKNIFDPFYRGENVGKTRGAGLGLSIAKNFAELHNGKIELECVEGKGVSVLIKVP